MTSGTRRPLSACWVGGRDAGGAVAFDTQERGMRERGKGRKWILKSGMYMSDEICEFEIEHVLPCRRPLRRMPGSSRWTSDQQDTKHQH